MAYVIAEPCIGTKDTACVDVCPVDCIHPRKDEPAFEAETQLYIHPTECIDCGACVPVCPVTAIPLLGEIFERENSGHRANRDAGAAIDAFRRVDVELGLSLESRLILAGMNAVHRTDIHARSIFCANTRLGNHVSH